MNSVVNFTQYTEFYEKYNYPCDTNLTLSWNYEKNQGEGQIFSAQCGILLYSDFQYADSVFFSI